MVTTSSFGKATTTERRMKADVQRSLYTTKKKIYRKVNLRGVVKTYKGHTCEMVYDYL